MSQTVQKLKRRLPAQAVILCGFFLLFLGCVPSRDEICREFPAVSTEINSVMAQMSVLIPGKVTKGSRSIASTRSEGPDGGIANLEEFTEERRVVWLNWGEKALKRTQWVKDSLETDQRGWRAATALNEAGLYLVSFHGFLDQRKWKKAAQELDRVDSSLRRARKIACEAEVSPPKVKSRK